LPKLLREFRLGHGDTRDATAPPLEGQIDLRAGGQRKHGKASGKLWTMDECWFQWSREPRMAICFKGCRSHESLAKCRLSGASRDVKSKMKQILRLTSGSLR